MTPRVHTIPRRLPRPLVLRRYRVARIPGGNHHEERYPDHVRLAEEDAMGRGYGPWFRIRRWVTTVALLGAAMVSALVMTPCGRQHPRSSVQRWETILVEHSKGKAEVVTTTRVLYTHSYRGIGIGGQEQVEAECVFPLRALKRAPERARHHKTRDVLGGLPLSRSCRYPLRRSGSSWSRVLSQRTL